MFPPDQDDDLWRVLSRYLRPRRESAPTSRARPRAFKVRLKSHIDWTFGGTSHRHVSMHKNGGPFFGMGRESEESDAGVQGISSAIVDLTPGDYLELII